MKETVILLLYSSIDVDFYEYLSDGFFEPRLILLALRMSKKFVADIRYR